MATWQKCFIGIGLLCYGAVLPEVLGRLSRTAGIVIVFVIGTFALIIGGWSEGLDEIEYFRRKGRQWWKGFSVEFSDKWDRDEDTVDYERKWHSLAVRYRKPIPDLEVQIVAIDPPISGLPLPLSLLVGEAIKRDAYGVTYYEHFINVIEAKRIHRDGQENCETEHLFRGTNKALPRGIYKLEIVARSDGSSWYPVTVWAPYDATNS